MKDIWDDRFNPFNSMKVLLWRQHLEGMANGKLLPPVTVDFDPTNLCNSKCIWCNSKTFRKNHPDSMSTQHMIELAEFLGKWGVKSACVAGGGEPMLNPGTSEALYKFNEVGIKTGVITNGIQMSEKQMVSIVDNSTWCGFSIDAGDKDDFKSVHGVDKFEQVIKNLTKLIRIKEQRNSNVEITYKYLLHPNNAESIFKGAIIAKAIGCDMMQVRPVCWDNLYDQPERDPIDFKPVKKSMLKQMTDSNKLTDNEFKFFGVRHKFGEDMERKVAFNKCRAVSIMAVYCADGNIHLCHDLRGKKDWILCSHKDPKEILDVWGSKKHIDMINNINPNKCPRCTFETYNEIIEKVIMEDRMYMDFP